MGNTRVASLPGLGTCCGRADSCQAVYLLLAPNVGGQMLRDRDVTKLWMVFRSHFPAEENNSLRTYVSVRNNARGRTVCQKKFNSAGLLACKCPSRLPTRGRCRGASRDQSGVLVYVRKVVQKLGQGRCRFVAHCNAPQIDRRWYQRWNGRGACWMGSPCRPASGRHWPT